MIIPGMVWLLIWKSFYEPDSGLFNHFLNATGLMSLLQWMDYAMPTMATGLQPIIASGLNPVFGGIGAVIYIGFLLAAASLWQDHGPRRYPAFGLIFGLSCLPFLGHVTGLSNNLTGGIILGVIAVVLMVGLARALGDRWISWPFLILAGVFVMWGEFWRLPLYVAIALALYWFLHTRSRWVLSSNYLRSV